MWSVTVGKRLPSPPDHLASLPHSQGKHPSESQMWGEGELPWGTWVHQSSSCRDWDWTAHKMHFGWFLDIFQCLVGEEWDSDINATEADTSQHIWGTKQKANIFRTLLPVAEAIPQMAKPSQIFQYGNRSHSFVGNFFCPPKIPKLENIYRKLLFIQGHQDTNQVFCYTSQKIRNKSSDYEKHMYFRVWVIFPLFGAILVNL